MRPVTPPKFLRDNINHDDIEGSKPKKQTYFETRDIMSKKVESPRNLTHTRKASYSNMDYRDVTHAEFKTTRHTNPLDPTYKTRDDDNNVHEIGPIDGNKPLTLPNRSKGPKDMTLHTNDIFGATSSTKALGPFHDKTRKDFRKTNAIKDIEGTQVGSLMKGPATKRSTNPLVPDYVAPGDVEYKGTIRHAMDRLGDNEPPKKCRTTERKPPQKEPKPYVPNNKQLDKNQLNKDRNTFYGYPGTVGPDIDTNKLYQATKLNKEGKGPGVPDDLKNNRDFRYNQKKFYAQSVASQSELAHDQAKFYKDTGEAQPDAHVNKNSTHFKKDASNFHGQSFKDSDKGSVFRENAERYYGSGEVQKKEVDTTGQHFRKD